MRLGTYYRSLMLDKLGITANKDFVLDVGSFDGYWLSQQTQPKIKIALDINPNNKFEDIIYIQADALYLPFKSDIFDQVFAFDVIEHVVDDEQFIKELIRVVNGGCEVLISTPHKEIKIFPSFLTNWVSKKWGHYRVNGYLDMEIRSIVPKNVDVNVVYLREQIFRTFYFVLRFLWEINEKIGKCFVKVVAHMDYIFLGGKKGHLLITVVKNEGET